MSFRVRRPAFQDPDTDNEKQAGRTRKAIAEQCSFKARIVAGDEFEAIDRKDCAFPQNPYFGHRRAMRLRQSRHIDASGTVRLCYGMIVAENVEKARVVGCSELESL